MNNFIHTGKEIWKNTQSFANIHKSFFVVSIIAFLAMLVISFIDVVTSQTVVSLSLSEYSVNQIADRSIIAEFSLEASGVNESISILEGEEITKKGFPITEEQYAKLTLMAETPTYIDIRAFGNAFLFLVLFCFITIFIFSPVVLGRSIKLKETIFFVSTLVITYSVVIIGKKLPSFSDSFALTTILPATFFAMLITIMFDVKLSVLASFLLAFIIMVGSDFSIVPGLFSLCSSLFATAIIQSATKRITLTIISFALALINIIVLTILEVIFAVTFNSMFVNLIGVALNGFISGILILGFLTPLEYICNTASVFRLLDLSDLNNALMKRMMLNAPGTYNHSMLVATLAESACNEIGANGLLARVGSYYHDIGKIEQPEYFVENQRDGNKHDEINPRLSVSVIRNHVKRGVERCRQLHLPDEVTDIVSQHHGNSTIYYFYNEAKKTDPDALEEDYSYTGVKPTSKEAAVVMICDTVEAACRTLKDPSVSRLEKFIKKLVTAKIENNQMDNANLTFNDLNKIQSALVNIMAGYYHSRIEYPDQNESNEQKTVVVEQKQPDVKSRETKPKAKKIKGESHAEK